MLSRNCLVSEESDFDQSLMSSGGVFWMDKLMFLSRQQLPLTRTTIKFYFVRHLKNSSEAGTTINRLG